MEPAAVAAPLVLLESSQREDRLQGLEKLKCLPQEPCEMDFSRRLATAVTACLEDESLEVCCRCATVAPEVLEWLSKAFTPSAAGQSAAASSLSRPEELQRALQRLAENLGDSREAVRAATQQGLASFAACSGERLVSALRLVIDFGFPHVSSWRVRLHSILSVQQLISSSSVADISDADLAWLLESLVPSLNDSTQLVMRATEQTLSHLECVLNERFDAGACLTPPATKQLLEDLGLCQDLSRLQLRQDTEKPSCSSPVDVAAAVAVAATTGPASPAAAPREFQPHQVLEQLNSAGKWQERARILEEFHESLRCTAPEEVGPHMSEVLLILNRLLTDTNFKITLTTLYIIGDLVDRFASCMMTVVGAVVPGMVEKLGDCKIVIRQTVSKIFHKIFSEVVRMESEEYADRLLHLLTGPLSQRSAHLRLELVAVITMAVLIFESGGVTYDREEALRVACQTVQDPDEKVAALAMEILAVLRPATGYARLWDRLAAVLLGEKIVLERVQQRLSIDAMPTVTDEGVVEYPSLAKASAVVSNGEGSTVSTACNSPQPASDSLTPILPAPRAANAAVAMGRLGRKMFCLEGHPASREQQSRQRPVTTSASSAACGLGAGPPPWSPGNEPSTPQSAFSELPEFAGRSVASRAQARSLRSPVAASAIPLDVALLADFGGRGSPAPEAVLEDPGFNNVRSPTSPPAQGSALGSRQDRRRAPQPLRVNFKESLRDTLDESREAKSAKLGGNHSEWGGRHLDQEVVPPSPSSMGKASAVEGSPNYIPNWNRPTTRQVRSVADTRRAQTAAVHQPMSSGLLEDFEARSPLPAQITEEDGEEERVFRLSGRGQLLRQQQDLRDQEQQEAAQGNVAGKLQLLGRKGRARSQGSCRTTLSRMGVRPDIRNSRGHLDGTGLPVRSSSKRSNGKRNSSFALDDDLEKMVLAEADDDGGSFTSQPSFTRQANNSANEASTEFRNLFAAAQAAMPRGPGRPSGSLDAAHGIDQLPSADAPLSPMSPQALPGPRRRASGGAESLGSAMRRGMCPSDSPPGTPGESLALRRGSSDPLGQSSEPSSLDAFPGGIDPSSPSAGRGKSVSISGSGDTPSVPSSVCGQRRASALRSRNSKLVGPDGAPVLLDTEDGAERTDGQGQDLPALDHPLPDRWLDDVLRRLGPTSDWFSQFEALTDLRRIAKFSPQLLTTPTQLRPIVTNVVEILDSLRSAVARAALVCLHDLLAAYRKHMDSELHVVLPACLRKAVDPNSFLADEADKVLQAMCRSVSEARGLAAVLSFLTDTRAKNPRARAKLTFCLVHLIQRSGPRIFRSADIDRLTQLLAKLLADAAGAVRQLAKEATEALRAAAASQEEFDRFLCKVLGSQDLQKVRQALDAVAEASAASKASEAFHMEVSEASACDVGAGRRRGDESPKRRHFGPRFAK